MPRILTVDDSKALRMMVKKHLKKLELEIEEAEDGVKGLEKLEGGGFDLVLLDVTMPEMDGPTMLAEMRKRGDKTKVLMLTAESATSVIGDAMKQGIEGYILKPFKPAEVKGKVSDALGLSAGDDAATDVLLIEDLERVRDKLREVLPQVITMQSFGDVTEGTAAARSGKFRVVLVASTLEGADLTKLAGQLKLMQPDAALVLFTPKSDGVLAEARKQGFSDVFFKPFQGDTVVSLINKYMPDKAGAADVRVGGAPDNDTGGPVLTAEGDSMTLLAKDAAEPMLRYFSRVWEAIDEHLGKAVAECFDEVFVDFGNSPGDSEREVKLVAQVRAACTKAGMELHVVGTDRLQRVLQQSPETQDVNVHANVDAARAFAA